MKLLVVDDSLTSRLFIRKEVEGIEGLTIIEAKNGYEGIQMAQEQVPDLITMDINMPDIDGIEATSKIRESQQCFEIPIIIITGNTDVELSKRAFAVGAAEFFIKPFPKGKFRQYIEDILSKEENLKGLKVLVVDDSQQSGPIVSRILRSRGAEIMQVPRKADALQYLADPNQKFDIIITDFMISSLGDIDLCRYVRQKMKRQDIPIIVLTEPGNHSVVLNALREGANDYLIQPFSREELLVRIQNQQRLINYHKTLQQEKETVLRQHDQLKTTQAQLVQSEKMAGLGTLVAGVAHEINNPVNFVHVSSRSLETDLKKFKEFVFDLAGEDADTEIVDMFNKKFDRFFSCLQDINEGSTRIKTIVSDLRSFSRLDEAEQKQMDLVSGLESTLRLIRTQYQKIVEFDCDFQVAPQLECWPAQLNQVFMNILANACQAIQAKQTQIEEGVPGKVTLRTFLKDDRVAISFSDTGCGMSEEVRSHIFDPFFTTKEVGEGTGMGLSISFGIIQKHQGSIEVVSEEGVGTTMTVLLPMLVGG